MVDKIHFGEALLYSKGKIVGLHGTFARNMLRFAFFNKDKTNSGVKDNKCVPVNVSKTVGHAALDKWVLPNFTEGASAGALSIREQLFCQIEEAFFWCFRFQLCQVVSSENFGKLKVMNTLSYIIVFMKCQLSHKHDYRHDRLSTQAIHSALHNILIYDFVK